MTFERGFQSKANKISLQLREKLGLREIDAIDPWKICEYFDILVFKLSELPIDCGLFSGSGRKDFSAMTIRKGSQTCIVHNDWHNERRQRSNICHELGHIFLGHKFFPPLNDEGSREFDSGIEAEANFLGGCILLPNDAAHYILRNGIKTQSTLIFGISQDMLEYRLKVSGAYIRQKRSKKAA